MLAILFATYILACTRSEYAGWIGGLHAREWVSSWGGAFVPVTQSHRHSSTKAYQSVRRGWGVGTGGGVGNSAGILVKSVSAPPRWGLANLDAGGFKAVRKTCYAVYLLRFGDISLPNNGQVWLSLSLYTGMNAVRSPGLSWECRMCPPSGCHTAFLSCRRMQRTLQDFVGLL